MNRNASAVWEGDLKRGRGTVSTASGALKNTPYSFTTRFEESVTGTNPEELIAAAHAACFSMALSAELGKAGMNPSRIATNALLTMEKQDAGWSVTSIHLETTATIPGAEREKFEQVANAAKAGCPISRLLNTRITLNAKLA